MITKGNSIKLVKSMGEFTNIGEICEVLKVTDEGVISFKFGNGMHLGCMSYNEFEKYFEKIETPIKREWSDWKEEPLFFRDIKGHEININIKYRDNGKKVQVRSVGGLFKGESTCNKSDEFKLDKGINLAICRLIVKFHTEEVKNIAASI